MLKNVTPLLFPEPAPSSDKGRKRRLVALPTPTHPPLAEEERRGTRQLWLALELPWLSLELFVDAQAPGRPFAVSDNRHGVTRVVARNRAARTAGIRDGMRLNAAYALVPTLRVQPREAAAERAALERLAAWAGRFTPRVVLAPPPRCCWRWPGANGCSAGWRPSCGGFVGERRNWVTDRGPP